MKICGFVKNSFVDYPSTLCSVVFLSGCNMNCYYCHNSTFAHSDQENYTEEQIIEELNMRKDFIDGVVISGGEPTLNQDLPDFIVKIKHLGLKVKLDTNGTNYDMLVYLIDNKLIDYVAMDIKAPNDKYNTICGKKFDLQTVEKSIELLKQNKVTYEFRTTFCDKLTVDDIEKMKPYLIDCQNFYLQRCNENDADFNVATQKLLKAQEILKNYCSAVSIRNL